MDGITLQEFIQQRVDDRLDGIGQGAGLVHFERVQLGILQE